MKLKPLNGWTRARILERIEQYVPDTVEGCWADGSCVYERKDGARCAVGALLDGGALLTATDSQEAVPDLLWSFPALADLLPFGAKALESLQNAHDEPGEAAVVGAPTARARCRSWILANVAED